VITIERYRRTRFWAVYEQGELLCVTVYRKVATVVRTRLDPPPNTAAERRTTGNTGTSR
jgi:hypothetical protein